ncbi:MAG: nucleotidyl transferase AbiEii/AbiGii toxin family protein [Patescibacteria group bacterium]
MITRQFITELSTKNQTSEQNIAREYCQHLFLSYLYKRNGTEKMLFKGGTALRIIFKSPRFSEDLDFSAYNISIPEINQLVDEILKDINKEGIQTEKKVNPGTDGETSGGYFTVVNLKLMEFDSEIKVQVSLRPREQIINNIALIENDFIPPYTIVYLEERLLVGEKVQALLERAKPRDFFDLYFMLRHRELVKFIPKDIENLKVKLLNVLQNGWEKELKLFLPVSYQTLIKDFQERLKKEIDLHIAEN